MLVLEFKVFLTAQVVIAVSVQYLQKPEEIFSEIHRMLKPGGVCIVRYDWLK